MGIVLFSCKNYQAFVINEPIIKEVNLKGNKIISNGEISSSVNFFNNNYKRPFSPKFYYYLASKRKLKDSLNKKSNLQFFTELNPVLDSIELNQTKQNLSYYYQQNGFLNSKVDYYVEPFKNNYYSVNFLIQEGNPSILTKKDSIAVNNPAIKLEIQDYIKNNSLIKENKYLTIQTINDEKKNLEEYLKNKGYYKISDDVISIQINDVKDTSLNHINLVYQIPRINYQTDSLYDRVFRFDTPIFNLYDAKANSLPLSQGLTNKLNQLINIKFGDIYSQEKINRSLENLTLTDQFRSTNLEIIEKKTLLKPQYELISQDKYNFSAEFGGSVFRGIPGPFISNSFKIRRVFSFLDYLEFSSRIGVEAQAGFINTLDTRKNLDITLQSSYNIPYLKLPENYLDKRIFRNTYSQRTEIGLAYNYINRPEYARNNISIFQNFYWRKANNKFYKLSLFNLNIINTDYPNTIISSQFQNYLNELRLTGNNLYRSFNPSFVSNIYFTYLKTNLESTNKLVNGNSFRYTIESGGTLLNFTKNKYYSFVEGAFKNSSDLQFYRYLKLDFDLRKYILLGYRNNTQIAFKLNSGFAYSYSKENGYQLPYEKNFFIGGPSSIRAWRPRRLGPGGFQSENELIEKPGSILIESSAEFRFKIVDFFGKINGAYFIDAGNIWNFNEGNAYEDGDFSLGNFYKQFAVGTGFGLRWDFTYFLLRLDMASKVIDPSKDQEKKWVFNQTKIGGEENPILFNIGIGYPF